jgi:hypothetical protein
MKFKLVTGEGIGMLRPQHLLPDGQGILCNLFHPEWTAHRLHTSCYLENFWCDWRLLVGVAETFYI